MNEISKLLFFLVVSLLFHLSQLIALDAVAIEDANTDSTRVIVKVDNQIATNYDLDRKVAFMMLYHGITLDDISQSDLAIIRGEALSELINDRIIGLELQRMKISFSQKDIDKMTEFLASSEHANVSKIREYFKSYGMESEYRNFIISKLFFEQLKAMAKSKIYISDLEIKENQNTYELVVKKQISELKKLIATKSNQSDSDNLKNVNIAQLTITITGDTDNTKKIQINKIIEDVENDIRSNMDFNTLLKKYADHSNNKDSSSTPYLGWFKLSDLSKEYISALKGLKNGQFSKPIITNNNVVFLLLLDSKLNTDIEGDDLKKAKKLLAVLESRNSANLNNNNTNLENILISSKFKLYLNNYIGIMRRSHLIQLFI